MKSITHREVKFYNLCHIFFLAKLSDEQIRYMMFRMLDDMPYRKISKLCDVTHQAVSWGILEAVKKIRKCKLALSYIER